MHTPMSISLAFTVVDCAPALPVFLDDTNEGKQRNLICHSYYYSIYICIKQIHLDHIRPGHQVQSLYLT